MFASLGTPAPDANFVLQLLLAAVLIGNALAIWLSIANRRSLQKREITFSFEPASKEEFTAHVERNQKEHDQIFARIGGAERGLGQKVEAMDTDWHQFIEQKFATMIATDHASRTEIHKRINALEKDTAGTRAAVELQTGQLGRLDKKIDEMPDRILANLANLRRTA